MGFDIYASRTHHKKLFRASRLVGAKIRRPEWGSLGLYPRETGQVYGISD